MTYINYEADTQRHRVRASDGKCTVWGKPATFIRATYTTADGKTHKALLSTCGYQGLARHFHYAPDIVNLFLYCSPAGECNGLTPGLRHLVPAPSDRP